MEQKCHWLSKYKAEDRVEEHSTIPSGNIYL